MEKRVFRFLYSFLKKVYLSSIEELMHFLAKDDPGAFSNIVASKPVGFTLD